VAPGDYPDPSVLREGSDYWAVVTSGGWRPPFSVLHSRDLVNWEVAGSVLRRAPEWARDSFWAPELVKRGSGYLVYYSARSLSGRFCIAVASARSPIGFFRDRGPLVCTRLGAIDPLPVFDEGGRPYLVWKDDGNARRRPTPILAAPLRPDGLRLAGPPRELFRNDAAWEGQVVEAPALVRRAGSFYMFYSARSCCGPRCDYVIGVARSPTLLGRWEKRSGPILSGNEHFRCPGHGTVVDGPGNDQYLLYHAYAASGGLDVGRQLLLDRIDWTQEGWPQINGGRGPSQGAASPGSAQQRRLEPFVDEFRGRFLTAGWQWSAAFRPTMHVDPRMEGRLWLGPGRDPGGRERGVVARRPGGPTFVAEAVVGGRRRGARPGLAAFADVEHVLGVELRDARAVVWRRSGRWTEVLGVRAVGRPRFATLRLRALTTRTYAFEVDAGGGFHQVGPAQVEAPRWRGEARVVLRVAGPPRARGAFERFSLGPPPEKGSP
jgi:GH43 family beta-xylosidase